MKFSRATGFGIRAFPVSVLRAGTRSSTLFPLTSTTALTEWTPPASVFLIQTEGGTCAYWSVADWDAPQFSPTEDPQFVAQFGEDHPLRQYKFYGTENREAFGVAKKAALDTLPLPHRFTARVSAPVGIPVPLRFHVGNWGLPEHQRWEDYWLDEVFVMTANAEPFVVAPLGTEPTPEPVTPVTPDLLTGNPYSPLLPTPAFAG